MKRASQRQLPVYVSQVSITALLDLVLVLLLVFIVAVPFLRRENRSTEGEEASMVVSEKAAPSAVIELNIRPDQSLLLNGRAVTGTQLMPTLKELLAVKPESGVLVKMPANFAAGELANLMDEMHQVGVRQTSVEVVGNKAP